MSFLNPLFLFGLAAAAIPILIHLFTRRRPREVRFPSLEFLSEVHQSEIRRIRLKQWLLLLLRTLAVAAIALAMARPALRGQLGPRRNAATTVVALVDMSGSMQAAAGAGEREGGALADVARRVAFELMTTLGSGDELLLVPYDRAPRPVTPRPSGDLSRLRAALRAFEPGAASTDHAQALAFAARAIAESHALNRELFWISDFQASGLADSSALPHAPEVWNQARVYLVPIAPRTRANASLADVTVAPGESGIALSVEGASFGAPPGDLAVAVRDASGPARGDAAGAAGAAANELGRGFLNLPERGRASALIPLSRVPAEGGEVRIPDDVLALDNSRWFAAGPAATLRVLLRENGDPSPLRLALEAGEPASGLNVETVDAAGLEKRARDADVIVLGDLERLGPSELQAVLDFWRAGGELLVTLGSHADAAYWSGSLLRELGLGALGPIETAPAGGAWRLHVALAGHPAIAGFAAHAGDVFSSAQFSGVRPLAAGSGRVLLEFDRAHPALIEAPRALVLAASCDPAVTDFPVSGAFLPLIHQAVQALARGSAAGSLMPGDRFRAPASPGAWSVVGPAGREVPTTLAPDGGTRLVSAPLDQPGLYRVLQGTRLRSVFAVNPDPRESDLAPIPPASLLRAFPAGRARTLDPGEGLARRVREARFGRELWREFVWLALALLVAEMTIARLGMGPGPGTKGALGSTPTRD